MRFKFTSEEIGKIVGDHIIREGLLKSEAGPFVQHNYWGLDSFAPAVSLEIEFKPVKKPASGVAP